MPRLNVRQRPGPPGSRQLSPDDAGAGVGRAVRSFGQTLGNAASQVERGARVGRQIRQTAAETRARRNAVEFDLALRAGTDEINANPDVDAREPEFNRLKDDLNQRFRPEKAASEFDFNSRVSEERQRQSLNARIRSDSISQIRADGEFQVNAFAESAATANSPDDRAVAILQGELEIDRLLADGAITQSDHDKRIRGFGKQVTGARVREFENFDPVGGIRFLDSDEFAGTTEEKEVFRSRLISKVESNVRHSNAASAAEDRLESLENKRLTKATTSKWITNLENGILPLPSEVAEASVFLPEATALAWQKRALSGGVERGPSNRDTVNSLILRAEDLDDTQLTDEVDKLFGEDKISKEERKIINKIRTDRQFGAGLSILSAASNAMRNTGRPGIAVAWEEAKSEYINWTFKNPDATPEEALNRARDIYGGVDVRGRINRSKPRVGQKAYVFDKKNGRVLVDETERKLEELNDLLPSDRNYVSDDEANTIMEELDALRAAEELDEQAKNTLGGGQ